MQAMSPSVDRISRLPDEVLIRILSFVTTRQAVQMSSLSKRWRHLWTSVPSLHFCDSEFFWYKEGNSASTRFLHFIDEVLNRKRENNNIARFHFSGYGDMDANTVRKWILHAVRGRKVKELMIESAFYGEKTIELPRCLFACRSLRVLKLDMGTLDIGVCNLELPITLCNSRLKSLHLQYIVFDDLQRLITCCPFLEDLYLRQFHCRVLKISARRLEKLTIYDSYVATIEVSAPSLIFNFNNRVVVNCILKNLVSLVQADIKIYCSLHDYDNRGILEGISNLSSISLTYSGIQRHDLPDELPMFENLTYLELSFCLDRQNIEVMIFILEHSPNLKTLVILINNPENSRKQEECCGWMGRQQSDQFLLHLSKIKIKNYYQSNAMQLEMQQKLVKYLLRKSRSVEEITITYLIE